jgi:serine/threonine protein kinase
LKDNSNLESVTLVDFGFGAQYSSESGNKFFSKFCGTKLYMAPELISEKIYSKVNILINSKLIFIAAELLWLFC